MKKILFLMWLIALLPALLFAEEKVEAPAWNVGDKWVFTKNGTIEVLSIDQYGYLVKFSDEIGVVERQGFNKIVFDKTNMQRIYSLSPRFFFLKGEKREKYAVGSRNILNFPFSIGKQWENAYVAKPVVSAAAGAPNLDYFEKYKILGWEETGVQAGKFRALKIEKIEGHHAVLPLVPFREFKSFYWYSPDAKYFVK